MFLFCSCHPGESIHPEGHFRLVRSPLTSLAAGILKADQGDGKKGTGQEFFLGIFFEGQMAADYLENLNDCLGCPRAQALDVNVR